LPSLRNVMFAIVSAVFPARRYCTPAVHPWETV
jgi:hypothetical protein